MAGEQQLPPLAGLRIVGDPTATEAPPAQRTRRDPDAPSALAGASGDAIALMITHAGLNARRSDDPPSEMCEWMKNFCRAGKYQGVAGCEDSWYFHALAAFGIDPMSDDVPSALPSNSGFKSWRELFGTLCECYYGSAAPLNRGPVANAVGLQMGTAPFWNFTKSIMGGGPVNRAFTMRFIDPNANQRELDVLMNGLFEGRIAKQVRHRGSADEIVRGRQAARERLRHLYELWMLKDPSNPGEMSTDASPWMALVTLLGLRGAEPWQLAKYRAVDRELYAAIRHLTEIDTTTPAIAAEQLRKARSALDRHADPNYNGNLEERVFPLVTPTVPDPPPVLEKAVMASDGPILKLLLERGAVLPRDNVRDALRFFDALLFSTAFSPLEHWRVDRETTERLIGMLLPFVRSLPPPMTMGGVWTHDRAYTDARIDRALNETNPLSSMMPQWLRDAWRALKTPPPPSQRRIRGERA